MASDDAFSESPRPQHRRTSSTISLGKTAAGAGAHRAKSGKTHTVGKHNRNRSLKDLTKLAKLAAVEDAGSVMRPSPMTRTSSTPGHPSSTAASVKRNKSDVALSRLGSKAHIKKNQSAVNLRRNESSSKLKRLSRPTTPHGPKDDDAAQKHTQPDFTIDVDDEEDDEEEWTEESASVSPVITRHGSMKGQRPNLQTNGAKPGNASPLKNDAKAESPTTPIAEAQRPVQKAQAQYNSTSSLAPDPTAITSRLLRRTSSQQLAPKLSTISAGGSSGQQSPSQVDSNGQMTISQTFSSTPSESAQQSMPSEGVSRFLDPGAASSSGRYTASPSLQTAMGHIRAQNGRTRSPSPNPGADNLRRAKSTASMSWDLRGEKQKDGKVKISGKHQDADQKIWTIDPANYRRSGGNTQAKMDLWRTQSHVEPSAQPPAPLLRSTNSHGTRARTHMGADERKIQQAEVAEAELGYIRMYRNPAVESVERLKALRKKQKDKTKKRPASAHANGTHTNTNGVPAAQRRARREDRDQPTSSQETSNGTPGSVGTTVAGSAGTAGTGRRNVRFSVGSDAHEESHDDVTEEARLASMLRGLWYGGEGDTASVD